MWGFENYARCFYVHKQGQSLGLRLFFLSYSITWVASFCHVNINNWYGGLEYILLILLLPVLVHGRG